ncbi:hypothetical protein [Streptomyces griseocarneus]|nr:hypothetical protein [Streptomyces griseocarneus]
MPDDIAFAKIHPAIGVARVGNSTDPDGWFLGPLGVLVRAGGP